MKKKTGECDVGGTRSCNPCRGESVLHSSGIVALLHAKASANQKIFGMRKADTLGKNLLTVG